MEGSWSNQSKVPASTRRACKLSPEQVEIQIQTQFRINLLTVESPCCPDQSIPIQSCDYIAQLVEHKWNLFLFLLLVLFWALRWCPGLSPGISSTHRILLEQLWASDTTSNPERHWQCAKRSQPMWRGFITQYRKVLVL